MVGWPLSAGRPLLEEVEEVGVVVPGDVAPVDVVDPSPELVVVPVDVPLEAEPDDVLVEPDEVVVDPDVLVVDPDVVVVEPGEVVVEPDVVVVAEPGDVVVVEPPAAAVCAAYGSRGAPPLDVELGAGVDAGVGVEAG